MRKIFLPALLASALGAAPLWAQPEALHVTGHVAHPLDLTIAQIKALPPITVSVSFQTGHGAVSGAYRGALLLDIVKEADPVDQGGGKGAPLRHTIIATGHDGYGVALAIGEIDPRLAGKRVIVAYERDGKPMTLRLVVPGDAHGARSVNDLETLTIN